MKETVGEKMDKIEMLVKDDYDIDIFNSALGQAANIIKNYILDKEKNVD